MNERHIRLFRNGRNQALCISSCPGQEAVIRKEGTLVTDNEREFGRVPGLTLENWLR